MNLSEQAITKTANLATYGGAGGAVYFGLSPGEWQVVGIISGIVIGLLGWLTNAYFKSEHLKLARQQHRADSDA